MATDTRFSLSPPPLEQTTPRAAKPPRYWPGVVMLTAYWAFAFTCRHLELSMLVLFLSRVAVLLLLIVAFSIWWLTNRRIPRRERWVAVAVTLGGGALAVPLTLTTLGPAVVLVGLLFVFTLGTLWLLVSKWAAPPVRCWGLWTTIGLVWLGCTLVRGNGLSGDQESDVRWRWEPTAEELFLAEHKSAGDAANYDATVELAAGDWPEFRGPRRDGRIEERGLALDWNKNSPRQAWKKRVGPSWSSLIVIGSRLYTQEQRGPVEAVVCYEVATGSELWEHKEEGRFEETVSGAGPRATPTFADGRIYAAGAKGKLICLDAANGREIWKRDVTAEAGATPPQWGISSSPLVVEGLVVAFAGGPEDKGLLAYRADTGELVWRVATGNNTYSSPQLVSLDGTKQILFVSDRGLIGIEPSSGVVLWEHSFKGMPAIQPHVVGDTQILTPAGEGLSLVEVHHRDGAWSVEPRWTSRALRPSFNDVVIHGDAIYGFDEGIFCCVDLRTGKRRWKGERYGHGQMMFLVEPSLLLVISEKGAAILLPADPEQADERGRFQAIEGKTWNHPVIAHGRLYLRNDEEMVCYELHSGMID